MKYGHILIATIILLGPATHPAFSQSGLLSQEAPLSGVPGGMTFEEYQDMNRSLTVGLLLAVIPIPGMLHYYANEEKTHLLILSTAAIGVGSLVIGSLIDEKGDFPDSEFDVLTLYPGDMERERRFEKTPIEIVGLDTTYQLREISRKKNGVSFALKFLGAAMISGAFAYDILIGIHIIQEKRDLVRFKYGKQIDLSIKPDIDLRNGAAALTFELRF